MLKNEVSLKVISNLVKFGVKLDDKNTLFFIHLFLKNKNSKILDLIPKVYHYIFKFYETKDLNLGENLLT